MPSIMKSRFFLGIVTPNFLLMGNQFMVFFNYYFASSCLPFSLDLELLVINAIVLYFKTNSQEKKKFCHFIFFEILSTVSCVGASAAVPSYKYCKDPTYNSTNREQHRQLASSPLTNFTCCPFDCFSCTRKQPLNTLSFIFYSNQNGVIWLIDNCVPQVHIWSRVWCLNL